MADTTISGLARALTTNTGAILPITIAGETFGIPVSAIITASGSMGTNAFQLPVGTTAQRVSTALGSVRYNSNADLIEFYTTQGWVRPAVGVAPNYSIIATGGTETTYVSGGKLYKAHIFSNVGNNTFTVQSIYGSPVIDVMVIGGGGGGGAANTSFGGGGGGAGSLIYGSGLSVGVASYSVVVGDGGNGGVVATPSGTKGGNSSFDTYVATGGGGGGGYTASIGNPTAGGSGGGSCGGAAAGTTSQTAYTGFTSYLNNGGFGSGSTSYRAGGGGGGAGGVGESQNVTSTCNGGSGVVFDITGSSVCYAGGGGGGGYTTIANRGIGTCGGGSGGVSGGGNGFAGTANTGGGGGGVTSNASTGFTGGKGGSGIVVVRYQI